MKSAYHRGPLLLLSLRSFKSLSIEQERQGVMIITAGLSLGQNWRAQPINLH